MQVVLSVVEAEGTYDAVPLENFRYGSLWTKKVSDTEQEFSHRFIWGDTVFEIHIPILPLTGTPFVETRFDAICTDATIKIDETEYKNIRVMIKGWIKNMDAAANSAGSSVQPAFTRMSPYIPSYNGDIEVECTIEGEILQIHITELVSE